MLLLLFSFGGYKERRHKQQRRSNVSGNRVATATKIRPHTVGLHAPQSPGQGQSSKSAQNRRPKTSLQPPQPGRPHSRELSKSPNDGKRRASGKLAKPSWSVTQLSPGHYMTDSDGNNSEEDTDEDEGRLRCMQKYPALCSVLVSAKTFGNRAEVEDTFIRTFHYGEQPSWCCYMFISVRMYL